jgi:ATP-binding cassette subfamily F protein 3
LEAAVASKNKSKDIHLPSIDVNFGSNRILCVIFTAKSLCNGLTESLGLERPSRLHMVVDMVLLVATVTISLCPSNANPSHKVHLKGVGKSTLLRQISMREVPIPAHITILFVEQEVRTYFSSLMGSFFLSNKFRLLAMTPEPLILS